MQHSGRPPRMSSKRRIKAAAAMKLGPPPETLSSFIYYRKDGSPLNIDIRLGSMLDEKIETIAFSVDQTFSTWNGLCEKVCDRVGNEDWARMAIGASTQSKRYPPSAPSGFVASTDISQYSNRNDWKWLLLCVMPQEQTLPDCYKNILKESDRRGLTAVTVTALGCGEIGISARTSATAFIDAIMSFDASHTTTLTNINILDIQRPVLNAFIAKLNDYVADLRHLPENRSKLVCVDNQNQLDFEARSYSTMVAAENVEEGSCIVCLDDLRGDLGVCALACNHQFHFHCFKNYLNCMTRKCCPVCRSYFAVPCGNQPVDAQMYISTFDHTLEGYEDSSTRSIEIQYSVPNGVQDETHLRPGLPYRGTTRVAFLPDNADGRKVLRLLKKAFECRLIFTVGDSVTTGRQNVVTWNCIHHKTSLTGGAAFFGFPDPTYIVRVLAELEEAGITQDLLSEQDTHHPRIHDRS